MIARREQVLAHVVLGAFAALALWPVAKILLLALGDPGNFATAWEDGHFATYLRSSAIVTVSVVAIATFVSILAGYAFGQMRFRGGTALFYVFLLGLMVPLEATIVPLYYDLRDVGLTDTYWALILPQVALSTSFGAFWMRQFFADVPDDLSDAAAVDGAGPLRTLWSVLLPLARPALGTLALLIFMWTWNEFLLALVLVQDEAVRTVPVGLSFFQGQYSAQVPLLAAAATIVSLPVLVLYALLHRKFIAGLAAGSVKA